MGTMNTTALSARALLRTARIPCAALTSFRFAETSSFDITAADAKYSTAQARAAFAKFDREGAVVHFSKDNATGVGHIVFENATGKNALTGMMFTQLENIAGELEAWKAGRIVVMQGAEGCFCSGGDLRMMKKAANPADGYTMNRYMGGILRRLRSNDVITVAKVEGYALGGGAELAMACDLRALHHNSKIGYVQSRIAVTPGWGTTGRLFKMVGREKALEMLALGKILTADEALEIGLATTVFSDESQFAKWIDQFTKVDLGAMRAAKRLINAFDNDVDFDRKDLAEREAFVSVWGAPAHLGALAAGKKMKK